MAEITKVAVDAMGGDNAPGEIVKGAVDAIAKDKNIKVFLVGKEEAINLDFVLRIREYPKKKNGKKKSVVLD